MPGSSVHGILQARILEWVAISFSRGSSWPRDWTQLFCIGRWVLYHWCHHTYEVSAIIKIHLKSGTFRTIDKFTLTHCNAPKSLVYVIVQSCCCTFYGFGGMYNDMWGFPGGSHSKESTSNAGDLGSIPGLGRSPGERNGYPLQYSCLENVMDREAWRATVHGIAKSQTWLNN